MERIMLWCINRRTGSVFISRNRDIRLDDYNQLRELILSLFNENKLITLTDIIDHAYKLRSSDKFKDRIGVSILQVKMDLEARGIIKVTYNPDRSQTIELQKRGASLIQSKSKTIL